MDDLKKIAPHLSKMKKETPFQVPENYFEEFSGRLEDKIHSRGELKVVRRRNVSFTYYLAAAILIIVALAGGRMLIRNMSAEISEPSLHAQIEQAVEENLYYISEETILDVMQYADAGSEAGNEIETDEIIDYLLNEQVPYDLLINEF